MDNEQEDDVFILNSSQTHQEQNFYVYCLKTVSSESTYIGATTDVNRRLRQHNKEISGGAKATGIKVKQGDVWERVCYVKGFPDWKTALQFEWMWKHLTKKQSKTNKPIKRRILALYNLLRLDKPTSKALPYSEWCSKPEIVIENRTHILFDPLTSQDVFISFFS